MRKAARRRLLLASAKLYFDAAPIAAEAAMFADDAASAAAVAAVLADIAAEAAPESGVVTTVVVDGAIVAGGVTVVVDSSFLLHAANETAAARVTINSAVFMFLLDFKFGQLPAIVGTLFGRRAPSSGRHGKLEHFQCLTQHYRGLRCFP
jgi:hypothetical protein